MEKYGKNMEQHGNIWENMGYDRYNQWYKPGESGCSMGFHHGFLYAYLAIQEGKCLEVRARR